MSKIRKLLFSPYQFFSDSRYKILRGLPHHFIVNITKWCGIAWLYNAFVVWLVYDFPRLWLPLSSNFRLRKIHDEGKPLVSVVIAAYRAEGKLVNSILSILQQSYRNVEVIVVVDGCLPSWNEAQVFSKHERVKLTLSSVQRGAAYSRNLGMVKASGQYLTFQDADDYSERYRIEAQLHSLIKANEKVISFCSYVRRNKSNNIVAINGRTVSLAVISMMVSWEQVKRDIGFFAQLERSEDSDYAGRIIAFYGNNSVVDLYPVHYLASVQMNSLTFGDGETIYKNNQVTHKPSRKTCERMKELKARRRRVSTGELSPYIGFPWKQ